MLEVLRVWIKKSWVQWLLWQINNLEEFMESDWCRGDPEMGMLARRELRNRLCVLRSAREKTEMFEMLKEMWREDWMTRASVISFLILMATIAALAVEAAL